MTRDAWYMSRPVYWRKKKKRYESALCNADQTVTFETRSWYNPLNFKSTEVSEIYISRISVYSLRINCTFIKAGRSFFFFLIIFLFIFWTFIDLFEMFLILWLHSACMTYQYASTYSIFLNQRRFQASRGSRMARRIREFPPFSGNRLPFSADTPSLPDVQCFSSPNALLQPCACHSINKIGGSETCRSPRRAAVYACVRAPGSKSTGQYVFHL